MTDFQIRALTPGTFPAFADLADRHNGIFGGCYCAYFHQGVEPARAEGEDNRAWKQRLVESGIAHAALVYDGDETVAWCEYGTPQELPNLHHRKQYDAERDLTPDYRLTCIFIDRRYRRQGLWTVALHGALELIAQAGGGVVEGYPHDLTHRTKKMSSSFLYNGTRTSYERAGFDYIRPKGLGNCVMRRTVAAA